MKKPKILVFAGSARNDSLNKKLAQVAAAKLRRAGAAVTVADLRDYPMPLYDGDLEAAQEMPAGAKAFKELVRGQDGLAIASPEHNGSFSALLKNAIDWISRPEAGERPLAVFHGKTAALLSGSPGPGGGQRGLRHLRELLEMIGVRVVPSQVTVARAMDAFDGEGRLARREDDEAVERAIGELVEAVEQQPGVAAA
jgi:NAD(P)H-dependent FMN reductase